MRGVEHCRRCLYTTQHPLGLTIDEDGICSGCRIHEEKDSLDWRERWSKLEALVKPYRSRKGNYDCIVPVSGAHDSYFIVHLVKNLLKLNPLLVTYNKYYNTPLGIWNLANLRIKFNCDILVQNVNPVSVRNITRTTLRQFGSIYWHCLAGQTVFPVQTAVRYGIPLIIWGAHQGLEQVGMFSHEHEVQMTRRYRKDHDLMGYEADDLVSTFDTLREEDLWQYRYPDDHRLNAVGVIGIYLGNYVRWDPKTQHEQMIAQFGYRTARFARTFDCYDYVDCFTYMGVHDELKLYRHGYSKVTDHACREIRHGRLSRSQGLALVAKHEEEPAAFRHLFEDWLGVTGRSLHFLMDQHRNAAFWLEEPPGTWSRREGRDRISSSDTTRHECDFLATCTLELDNQPNYVVIGKGYP